MSVPNRVVSLLDVAAEFFDSHDMQFERNAAELYLEARVAGAAAEWHCYAHAFEAKHQFVFYSVWPAHVPSELRPAIAQFVCGLNYLLAFGNLEMSLDSGELRLRTAVEAADGQLTFSLIAPVVFNNIGIMDDLASILLAMIQGNLATGEALEQTKRLMGS
jgi:hypothetical protein